MFSPFFTSKSYWQQLLYLLLFVVAGVTVFSSITALLGITCFPSAGNSREYLYIVLTVNAFGTFFVPALLFSYCASRKWFSYNTADKIAPPKLVGIVLLLSLFFLPVVSYLGYVNEHITLPAFLQKLELWMQEMEEASKGVLQTLTGNSNIPILLLNIVIMALLPALFEEFLFRGTLQPFFTKWFKNKHIAIIVTAFIFSAIHFQFYGFLPRFLLGIYLGYLLIWGKSLWLPIIAHFMHNAVSLILDYGAQRRDIDLDNIEPNQIPEFYPVVIFCVLCVGVGGYLLWKTSKLLSE